VSGEKPYVSGEEPAVDGEVGAGDVGGIVGERNAMAVA
jgi:hypothetical protein